MIYDVEKALDLNLDYLVTITEEEKTELQLEVCNEFKRIRLKVTGAETREQLKEFFAHCWWFHFVTYCSNECFWVKQVVQGFDVLEENTIFVDFQAACNKKVNPSPNHERGAI